MNLDHAPNHVQSATVAQQVPTQLWRLDVFGNPNGIASRSPDCVMCLPRL
jgi:hypothetical protein